MTQTRDGVRRRFEMHIRDQQDRDLVAQFDRLNIRALLVEEESCHINRYLNMHGACVFLHRLFFEDAKDVQCRRLGRADMTGAGTARAGDVAGFGECRA